MLDLTNVPVGTRVRLRGGKEARVIATGLKHPRPIVLAVPSGCGDREGAEQVQTDGKWWAGRQDHPGDVVEVIG